MDLFHLFPFFSDGNWESCSEEPWKLGGKKQEQIEEKFLELCPSSKVRRKEESQEGWNQSYSSHALLPVWFSHFLTNEWDSNEQYGS